LDEMKALSDKIVADGGKPWCNGIESGTATGWPVTDWMEDFVLRRDGPMR
jgi:alpha-glucoside transport system substrate-binding protein